MASDQTLTLEQRPQLRLSTTQLRFVKLLEFNTPELEEAVDRELEDNPALEVEDDTPRHEPAQPFYRRPPSNNGREDSHVSDFTPHDSGESLIEILLTQLAERNVSEKVHEAARYIIGNLDTNGYLRRPLPSIINDMAFGPGIEVTDNEAQKALEIVQSMEPYGVGASDLRECLRIQLTHLPPSPARENAIRIIDNKFDALTMKHTHKIISGLRLSKEETKSAVDLILSLNPKPGAAVNSPADTANIIVPDFVITLEEGDITISLNNRIPELTIGRSFSEAMDALETESKRKKKKGSEFIISRYNDARDFIRILRQRQETLMAVMSAIVKIQKDYFLTRDVYKLRPMMIKDISALTGYDLSVVSRATNNKYVDTPWGIFPLRFFFSDSIGEEGEDNSQALTNRKIEAEIAALVEKEDKRHPLSDEKIKQEMVSRGYEVSRRTVAKYRDKQGIPVARLRKEL